MNPSEVRDAESLERHFDTLNDEAGQLIARRVAFRASARVFPVALSFFVQEKSRVRGPSAIPLFGALAVANIDCAWPRPPLIRSAAAYAAFGAAYELAKNIRAGPASPAAEAVAATASRDTLSAVVLATAVDSVVWEGVAIDLEKFGANPFEPLPPLWLGLNMPYELRKAWTTAKLRMELDKSADWDFWIRWYERINSGREVHAEKLADILNPLDELDWENDLGPAHINPLFDDLLALYRAEDAALEAKPTQLSQAYFAEFSFDALAKVMVMIGIDNDTAHLRAPEVVQAFLDDSEEVRDLLQDFADDARALSGGNYAGVLQRKAEKLLNEFLRAGETTHLRARTIVAYCGDLELHAQEEKARNDLGQTLSKQLDQRVGLLKRLCLEHFGPAYLALTPLADMPSEHVDQGEVLRLLDQVLEQMRAPSQKGFVALDPEGVAVFEEMIRGLEATRAAIAEADSAEFRELLEARFAQSSGSIGVTALRYFEKSVVAGGQTADALIKANKRVSGLQDIVNRLKDWLPEGWA